MAEQALKVRGATNEALSAELQSEKEQKCRVEKTSSAAQEESSFLADSMQVRGDCAMWRAVRADVVGRGQRILVLGRVPLSARLPRRRRRQNTCLELHRALPALPRCRACWTSERR